MIIEDISRYEAAYHRGRADGLKELRRIELEAWEKGKDIGYSLGLSDAKKDHLNTH